MAYEVHITRDSIEAVKWDGESGQYVKEEMPSAISVLRCPCEIDSDVTLGHIFRVVEQDTDLARFLEAWAWCDIGAFHLEAKGPARIRESKLFHIELRKMFVWDKVNAYEVIDVSGIGPPCEYGINRYGISLTPVNELIHLPVRLQPAMAICNDHDDLGEAPCTFTLLDVLGEIYWEISYHGSPAERDQWVASSYEETLTAHDHAWLDEQSFLDRLEQVSLDDHSFRD